eukprot:scaffold110378_cov24-Tisochrysis_lutea.AAC.1
MESVRKAYFRAQPIPRRPYTYLRMARSTCAPLRPCKSERLHRVHCLLYELQTWHTEHVHRKHCPVRTFVCTEWALFARYVGMASSM